MLTVTDEIYLSVLSMEDAEAVTALLQDKEISDNTLLIPYPYTLNDAKQWLSDSIIIEEENGRHENYSIRNSAHEFVGVISMHFNYGENSARSEFGYWLGKKYWNKGIMTAVIIKFCEMAKEKYRVKFLEAFVFDFNEASMRALTKAGFTKTRKKEKRTRIDGTRVTAVKFEKEL